MDSSNIVFVSDAAVYDVVGFYNTNPPAKPTFALMSGWLYFPNGLKYRFDGGSVSRIEDRNGNVTTPSVDTLGRPITINAASSDGSVAGNDTISYYGFSGAQQHTITISRVAMSSAMASGQTIQTYEQLFPGFESGTSLATQSVNPVVPQSIILPDGTSYQFTYTSYGDVASITLPTGAKVTYQWDSTLGSSCTAQPTFCVATFEDGVTGNPGGAVFRRLLSRREMADGSTVSRTTSYSYSFSIDSKTTVTTVTEADGSGNVQSVVKHHYYGDAADTSDLVGPPTNWYSAPQNGKEFLTEVYNGTTTIQQTQQTWQQRPCNGTEPCWFSDPTNLTTATFLHDPQIKSIQTTLGSAIKTVNYAYDANNNRTDQTDLDWDNSTQLRWMHTDYNTFLNNIPTSYILDLPAETKTYDGSNVLVADTQYTYDGTPVSNAPNVVGHDPSYSGTQPRGNLTTVRSCVYTANGCNWTSATSTLPTSYTYDIAGNVISMTDPRGNVTSYGYADSQNTYAHMTSSTDAIGQTQNWTFDYYSGRLQQGTDANAVNTIYKYADPSSGAIDPFDRVLIISKADSTYINNLTNAAYTSPTEVNVYNDQNVTNDKGIRTQNLYDGFGRMLESRIYTGPSSYRSTPQTYDALGRVSTMTNELGGTTQYSYDPLGRRTLTETLSDTASATVSYLNNTSTTVDQAGNKRVSTFDGLGRLTSVVEDPTGLNDTTSYSYDGLGNLKSVSQTGQTRSFQYDSLSRLISATNPETGQINYSYDNAGNLQTRTDNRQILTSYTYDPLNRMTSKTYSSSTPSVSYTYCNPGSCNVPNGLTHMLTVSTGTSGTNNYTATANTAFTPMGQITGQTQIIGSASYPFTYGYTIGGSLVGEIMPSGRQMTYGYGYADEPQALGGVLGNTSTQYILWVSFQGFKETYRSIGSLNALVLNHTYNSREQLTGLTLHDWNNANNLQFQLFYGYGGSNNNGNLLSAAAQNSPSTAAVPSASLGPYLSQSYGYDTVNRLTTVTDNSYSRAMCYDAWGNGWVTNYTGTFSGNTPIVQGGSCPAAGGTTPYPANNQVAGVNYDAAGNETSFGGNTLAYDAENRQTAALTPSNTALASYGYDGNGRRISKTVRGVTTNYIYDVSGELTAEYQGGAVSKEYIRLHSRYIPANTDLVAIENAPSSGVPCTTCFVVADDLGSLRLLATNDGTAVSRHDYLPFGEEVPADGYRPAAAGFGAIDGATQRCTGKERDSESGLDYFGARYYGSPLGRFTSPDEFKGGFDNLDGQAAFPTGPLGYADISDPQTLNKYVYTRNNPLRYVDPDGHDFLDYLSGVANAFISDNALGAGRSSGGNNDFRLGQVVGDGVAVVTGALESLGGGGEAVLTSPAAATGIGVVIPAAGAAVAAHGATTAAVAGGNLVAAAVKASDAPGITASGQATDKYGNKLGPSGEPQINKTNSNTREGARNKALDEGSKAVNHNNPKDGQGPHYHSADAQGEKKPTSTHHNYPDN